MIRGVGDDHVSISLMDVNSIHRRVHANSTVGPILRERKKGNETEKMSALLWIS